jgi:pSer/pThr/pTyr-binding forkhead associated (FHA) protein
MTDSFGKLILIQPNAPELEYELGKSSIVLGRAMTSDIILSDGRVSRSHARLECGPKGCTLIDLGSSNGTRLNGRQIDRAGVASGDLITLGNTQLRFETAEVSDAVGMTMIDTEAQLDLTIDQEILPVAIHETRSPQLVIYAPQKTWEVSLEDFDSLTIGRTDDNQIVIEHPKVSRQHAELVRRGSMVVLRDLGSTNGTWHNGVRVDELVLEAGDTFRIGDAQLVFKGGFQEESLTMLDVSLAKTTGRRPVVFVPGLMGSDLWLGNERVWPNVKTIFKNPEVFRYPSDIPLEPRGIVDEVVIVPNLIKQDQYNRLGDYLVEDLGYERGADFFEFPYDWRQDVRISARQLGEFISRLHTRQPVIIIAHSLGTMVSRYYIEHLGGKERVERVILMGGPHQGAVKVLASLLVAPQVLPFGLMGERLRQIVVTFPTSYQIIPPYACGVDQNGEKINFLQDERWVSPEQIPLLRLGGEFRQELGSRSSIPAVSIFGYGIKTLSSISLERDSQGKARNIKFVIEPNGDSSILERSAVLDGTEIHPVQQYHGSLFVDNDVKMRLKLELSRARPD